MHWISLIPLYTQVNWSIGSSGNIFSAFMAWLRPEWKLLSPRISPVGSTDLHFLQSPIKIISKTCNSKKFVSIFFWERGREWGGREGERGRERDINEILNHTLVASPTLPTEDQAHKPACAQESNRQPFSARDDAQLSPTSQDVTKKIFVKQCFYYLT